MRFGRETPSHPTSRFSGDQVATNGEGRSISAAMRVVLFGATGQLGSDIVRLWNDPDVELVGLTRLDADVLDAEAVSALVRVHSPDVVINTTAFHNLPLCETDPETCFRVNMLGGRNVAVAAAEARAAVVQLSTDYVFDGEKGSPYFEDDARRAVNVYGSAKIATEDIVRQANPECLIVRASGLYGLAGSASKSGNFVETMLRLSRDGNPIRVVADQTTSPTNTAEVAEALLPLIKEGTRGVVHLAAAEGCNWHEFATAIFEERGLSVRPEAVTSAEFGGTVKRPAYSVLGTTRAPAMRHWRDGLRRYLAEKT
jgi:dTDP-4-dehydrorhamnose reductase